jgi:hypothetical protein
LSGEGFSASEGAATPTTKLITMSGSKFLITKRLEPQPRFARRDLTLTLRPQDRAIRNSPLKEGTTSGAVDLRLSGFEQSRTPSGFRFSTGSLFCAATATKSNQPGLWEPREQDTDAAFPTHRQ